MNPTAAVDRLKNMGETPREESMWKPGCGASKETMAAHVPLTPEQRWALMNSVTHRHIVTMFLCAGLAYLGLTVGQLGSDLDQTRLTLLTMYGLTAAGMLAVAWRAKLQPPPMMWSVHIGATVFLVITATVSAGACGPRSARG